jgi:tape measure domain-containing protein
MADIASLLVRIEANTAQLRGELAKADRAVAQSTSNMERSTSAIAGAFDKLGPALGGAFSGAALAAFARQVVTAGDAVKGMEARLTALTGSGESARDVLAELQRIGLQTGVAVEESAAGFGRFALAAKDIGATRAETLRLVETVQKLGIIAGASSADTSSAMTQLAQGLASGKLQGDELRSIMETMPTLAKQVADGLGVSIGKLREMGTAGELTADKVFAALLKGADDVNKKFAEMPPTVERELGQMAVAWQGALAALDKKLQASEFYKLMIGGARLVAQDVQGFLDPSLAQRQAAAMERFQKAADNRNRFATASWWEGGNDFQRDIAEREYNAARKELDDVTALILKEAELSAEREHGEKAAADQAKAEAERNRNLEARKKLLEGSLPLMKAAAEHDKKVAEAARLLGEGAITEAEYRKVYAEAEKEYAEAVDKTTGASKAAKEAEAERKKVLADGLQVFEQTRTSGEDYAREVERLRGLLDAGAISQDTFNRAVAEAATKLQYADAHVQDYLKSLEEMRDKGRSVFAATRTPQEQYNAKLAELDDLLAKNAISQDTHNRAVQKYREELANTDPVLRELGQFGERAFDRIGDAMTEMAMNGEDAFASLRNIGQAVISELMQEFVKLGAINPLKNAIFGSALPTLGSAFGSLFGGGGVQVYDAPVGPMPQFAAGGMHTGGLRLVGERGPEIEATGPSRIWSADQTRDFLSGGGGSGPTVVVNQTLNVSTGVQQTVRAEIMGMMPQIAAQSKAAVAEAVVRGGRYGAAIRGG